ncbi:hypothetical protein DYB32_004731, partial [Aphanomyces invadans]
MSSAAVDPAPFKHSRWLSSPNLTTLHAHPALDSPIALDTPATDDDDTNDADSVFDESPSSTTAENIRALVRIKPFAPGSTDRTCLSVDGASVSLTPSVVSRAVVDKKTFLLDGILPEGASQDDVFQAVAVPLATNVLDGYNGTIFAYGQTGSGKTYTMQVSARPQLARGLIELVGRSTIFTCTCSYLEIYNERIYDLLDERMATEAKLLREDAVSGIFVQDLLEVQVHAPNEALELLMRGTNNRTVGSTAMNRESSRSHSVFMIKLVQKLKDDGGVDVVRKSTLHLVDLAGSEKQSATGATSTRLKEASQINKSLSALSNVITGLVDVSKGLKRHIHYRDSKLTFLLRDALGGNSKTTVVATVSAHDKWFHETMSTLQFVQRVKCIKNNAKKYEDDSVVIARLEMQVRDLQRRLDDCAARPPPPDDVQTLQQKADELSAMKVNNEKLELVVTLLNGKVTSTLEELHATQQKLNDVEAECESLLVKQTLLECKLSGQARSGDEIAPMETAADSTTEAQTIKSLQDIVAELQSQLLAAENARNLAEKRLDDATNQKKSFSLFKGLLRRMHSGSGRKWWQRWKTKANVASSTERTSSIPRLNSSSKVHMLARKFELKIETNAIAAACSNQSSSKEAVVSSPGSSPLEEPQTPVNPNEETIRALVRIRPASPIRDEVDRTVVIPDKCIRRCLEPDPSSMNVVNFKQGADKRQFSVDGLLVDTATQDDVFKLVGMRVVDNAVDGYNGSIFAYGQTGSGKTHTMQGDMTEGSADRGVIPRIVDYLFEKLTDAQTSFDMTCSYLEIYNEKIYDLLDVISDEPKYIREDATLGLFVQDLVEMPVATPRAALHVLEDGGKNRTVGDISHLLTHSRGKASQINKSLSVLGNVITALVDVSNGIKRHVPYRDSKLTFLLRDALGGNSKTTLIATVSSEEKFSSETLSTLQFMQRAKHIKTVANKNEDTRTVIKQLQVDMTALRGDLDSARSTIRVEQAKRVAVQEHLARLQMEKEDRVTANDIEMLSLKAQVIALEAQIAMQAEMTEATRRQCDVEKQGLRAEIQDKADHLAHTHDDLDACQKMLMQMRLELDQARQTHTSDANLLATLREEGIKRDNDQAGQQEAWNQKLVALQANLAQATQQLDVERHEAAAWKATVVLLKHQLDTHPCKAAIGSFSIPSSIEEAHRDLQLQHDQLLHVMQKLDGLRNSKKFLQHALQTTLTDNADMVQSLKKLQQTVAEEKKAKKMHQIQMLHASKHSLGDDSAPTTPLPSLKRTTTTFSGFSTVRKTLLRCRDESNGQPSIDCLQLQKDEELKQLAADKVTLTARLKATQAKVASQEDEIKRL